MASDSDSDEDFVTYGTPLEPLEEDEPLKKPIPLHEQTVKDEKGRYQRFHGAFTGGFSAGYFNTVGSKEGWTPSTFVSSRQQKAEKHHARPEDFMDEEDFDEHGIAPRDITTSQEFTSHRRDDAQEKARAINAQAALIPGDTLLEELISPARSTIGMELLRRMGWKEGQGIGPRVKRKPRCQQTGNGRRVYGCALPSAGSEDSEDNDDDEFAPENVTFAPKDVTPVDFKPRSGVQGLGYRGLDPGRALLGSGASEHINLFKPQSEARSQLFGDAQRNSRRASVAGQAFGVGALEDDDEDIYHRDSMSRYDTVLGDEKEDGLYGWTAPQQYTRKTDKSRDASYLGKILEGFTLSQKPQEEKTIFLPPALPRDYRPVHRFQPSVLLSSLSVVSPALADALRTSRGHMVIDEPQQGGRHQLDSGQRRALLGEDLLQGPGSVLDLLRPEDRQRLLNLRNSSAPSTNVTTTTTSSHDFLKSAVAAASAAAASAAAASAAAASAAAASAAAAASSSCIASSSSSLQQQQEALASWRGVQMSSQTFRPFEKNPSKQARYELYLSHLRQGDTAALEQSLDPTMTEWERSREREEFVRASILYRPSSSSLSSRFTRAKQQEDDDTVEVSRDQEENIDDKQAAVNMNMFGKLTRETFEWHPDKLLCKRFNVPDPYPGSGMVGLPKVKRDKFSVFNFLTVTETKDATAPPKAPESMKKSRWDVSDQKEKKQIEPVTVDSKLQKTSEPDSPAAATTCIDQSLQTKTVDQSSEKKKGGDEEEAEEEEESRPPMDLFRAIFASSFDDKSSSSEGESEEEDMKEEDAAQTLNLFNVSSINTPVTSSITTSTVTSSSSSSTWHTAVPLSQEEFGPKLPPPSSAATTGGASSLCSTREEEKHSRRRRDKKHKNKKQHKHKKEKKKKKHKKYKHKVKEQQKKETSDSSSEDDEGGDEPVSTDELLKRLKSIRSLQTW